MRVVEDRDVGHVTHRSGHRVGTARRCHTPAVRWAFSGFPFIRATHVALRTRDTMHHPALHRRLPRAGIDVIDDSPTAFAMLSLSIHRPLRDETIVLLLDEAQCGKAIVVVSGTADPDAVIEVVDCITNTTEPLAAIVVGSVRPNDDGTTEVGGDVDRWLEMSDIADAAGVDLLEWYVIGRSVRCPRDLLGEPPRW